MTTATTMRMTTTRQRCTTEKCLACTQSSAPSAAATLATLSWLGAHALGVGGGAGVRFCLCVVRCALCMCFVLLLISSARSRSLCVQPQAHWYACRNQDAAQAAVRRRCGVHVASVCDCVPPKLALARRYEKLKLPFPPREIAILRSLSHPSICRLYDVVDTGPKVFLIQGAL